MKWPAIGICLAYYAYGSKYFHGKQIKVIVQESGLKKEKGKLRKDLKGDRTTLKNFKPFNVILMFTIKSFLWIGRTLEAF